MGQILTKTETEKLDAISGTVKFMNVGGICEAQVRVGDKIIASASGQSELEAVRHALDDAASNESPASVKKNQAEEIAKLKQELEDLKPAPTRRRKRAGATTKSESERALDTGTAAQDTSEN